MRQSYLSYTSRTTVQYTYVIIQMVHHVHEAFHTLLRFALGCIQSESGIPSHIVGAHDYQ